MVHFETSCLRKPGIGRVLIDKTQTSREIRRTTPKVDKVPPSNKSIEFNFLSKISDLRSFVCPTRRALPKRMPLKNARSVNPRRRRNRAEATRRWPKLRPPKNPHRPPRKPRALPKAATLPLRNNSSNKAAVARALRVKIKTAAVEAVVDIAIKTAATAEAVATISAASIKTKAEDATADSIAATNAMAAAVATIKIATSIVIGVRLLPTIFRRFITNPTCRNPISTTFSSPTRKKAG